MFAQPGETGIVQCAVVNIRVVIAEVNALGALQIRGGNALGEGAGHYNSVAPYTVMQPAMLRIFNLI